MKVGIIGCGLMGRKRAIALDRDDTLVYCYDINKEVGEKFASEFNCILCDDSEDIIKSEDVDIIIISVVNKYVKDLAVSALKNNKYVLIEKPMGRNFEEASEILSFGNRIKVGFNLRFHSAMSKAKQLIDEGSIGKILFMKTHYGHGGRTGMENEWRASKDLCGGGEMLDQGVHLIDLFRWFGGEIKSVYGKVSTKYWDIEVEDNAFVYLTTVQDVDIQMLVSWTTWKNTFSFEIYGDRGFIKINGLGGSYGQETIEVGFKIKDGEVPKTHKIKYDRDNSWIEEWKEFKCSINENRLPIGDGNDGAMANKVVDAIYESSKKNKEIYL